MVLLFFVVFFYERNAFKKHQNEQKLNHTIYKLQGTPKLSGPANATVVAPKLRCLDRKSLVLASKIISLPSKSPSDTIVSKWTARSNLQNYLKSNDTAVFYRAFCLLNGTEHKTKHRYNLKLSFKGNNLNWHTDKCANSLPNRYSIQLRVSRIILKFLQHQRCIAKCSYVHAGLFCQ